MSNLMNLIDGAFQWILQTTWQAAVLAGLILLAQRLLKKQLSPAWRYGLWLLLVVRLLMPVLPQSSFSIFNLAATAHVHPASPALASSTTVNEPGKTLPSPVPPVASRTVPPAAVQAAVSPAWTMDWMRVALYGWLLGVGFLGARLVWTNGRFRARISRYDSVTDVEVLRLFEECRAALKLTGSVRLIESEAVDSPAVYGLGRKWLLLPAGVSARFSPEELRCIFLHELAHIKRGDLVVNWLVTGLQILHWFNPVLWLAWARMRTDREMATDALALAHIRKSSHVQYGETILKVLAGLTNGRTLPELVGIVESKARLRERLTAIRWSPSHRKWAALAALALIAGIGLTGAQVQNSGSSGTAALTGTWQAQDVAFAPWTFTLTADDGKLTGTIQQGGANGNWTTSLTGATPIYDGTIAGDNISFKCDCPGGGRTISFSGVISGDTITFTRGVKVQPGAFPGMNGIYGASGATNFTATRVTASVAEPPPQPAAVATTTSTGTSTGGLSGTWLAKDVAFAPWTFTLNADDTKVTGTIQQGGTNGTWTTTLTGATAIYDGTVAGNNLSFKCDSPDGARTISFSGVLSGDTINFTREVKVQPGAFPGMNGIYGASGATNFTATRY